MGSRTNRRLILAPSKYTPRKLGGKMGRASCELSPQRRGRGSRAPAWRLADSANGIGAGPMMTRDLLVSMMILLPSFVGPRDVGAQAPWRALAEVAPGGEKAHTGSHVVKDRASLSWKRPPFVYSEKAATGRKCAKVIVVIYDPVLESEGGTSMVQHLKANDPVEYSHILA